MYLYKFIHTVYQLHIVVRSIEFYFDAKHPSYTRLPLVFVMFLIRCELILSFLI